MRAFEKRRQEFHQHAGEVFDRFIVESRGPNVWLCHNPKSFASSFRVILAPALVIIAGDLGDLILHLSDRDTAAWLKRNIESINYVLSKAAPDFQKQAFVPEALKEFLENPEPHLDLSNPEEKAFIEELRTWGPYSSQVEFYQQVLQTETGPDIDIHSLPEFLDWSNNLLWCYHALRWFVTSLGDDLRLES